LKIYVDVVYNNYNICFKVNTNIIVAKINTIFGQQINKYKFIINTINIYNYNSFKMYKKYITNIY